MPHFKPPGLAELAEWLHWFPPAVMLDGDKAVALSFLTLVADIVSAQRCNIAKVDNAVWNFVRTLVGELLASPSTRPMALELKPRLVPPRGLEETDLTQGARVRHPDHGIGSVVELEKRGTQIRVTVKFPSGMWCGPIGKLTKPSERKPG
jgi:hypothetical protein